MRAQILALTKVSLQQTSFVLVVHPCQLLSNHSVPILILVIRSCRQFCHSLPHFRLKTAFLTLKYIVIYYTLFCTNNGPLFQAALYFFCKLHLSEQHEISIETSVEKGNRSETEDLRPLFQTVIIHLVVKKSKQRKNY